MDGVAEANGDKQVRITKRDLELFHTLAMLKYLNAKQIAALFFVRPIRQTWDPVKSKTAAAQRISLLSPHYLSSSYIPGTHGEKCYFLGPEAITLLKADAEMADFRPPRYMERKTVGAIYNSLHDIPMNSLLINLMLLERLGFAINIRDMMGPGDLKFQIQIKRKYVYHPDAYVRGGVDTERACLFEFDTGAPSGEKIQHKVALHLEFRRQGMKSLLGINYNPVMCVLVPDLKRLSFWSRQIRTVKRARNSSSTFFLSTHEALDMRSIEQGHVSDKLLRNDCWYDDDGHKCCSPFRDARGVR